MTATLAKLGARLSDDHKSVIILFGNENEGSYYGRFSAEAALKVAEHITKLANSILNIRDPEVH